jgi:hypothetical protein
MMRRQTCDADDGKHERQEVEEFHRKADRRAALMSSTVPVPVPESFRDELDAANRRLRRRAVLLFQLFDALSNPEGQDKALVDFGSRYEADFWAGLRDVMQDILRASEEVQQHADGLRSSVGVAPPPALEAVAVPGHETRAADTVAIELAQDALMVDLGQIIDDHQEGWKALVDAVRTERFPRDQQALDDEEPLDVYSKVMTTLPVELRGEFRRFTQSKGIDEIVERYAAFELGRQIERHAGDARAALPRISRIRASK